MNNLKRNIFCFILLEYYGYNFKGTVSVILSDSYYTKMTIHDWLKTFILSIKKNILSFFQVQKCFFFIFFTIFFKFLYDIRWKYFNISIFLVLHFILVSTSFNHISANFEKRRKMGGGDIIIVCLATIWN